MVPLSMMNRDGRQYRDTRAEMVERGFVSAVIELPTGSRIFTGTKFSIVIFERAHKHDSVYFLDLSSKGAEQYFMRNNGRMELKYGDSEKIAALVRSRQEIEGVSRNISVKEIADNDYRLSIGSYIQDTTQQEEALRAGVASWERRETLRKEFLKADEELEELLKDYNGYLNQNAGMTEEVNE